MAENEPALSAEVLKDVLGPDTQFVIRAIVQDTAERSVNKTLEALGFETRDPIQVQRDVATMREARTLFADPEYQRDMIHLRQWRVAMDELKSKGLFAALGFALLGVATLAYVGVRSKFGF